jgi:hypothetical protein
MEVRQQEQYHKIMGILEEHGEKNLGIEMDYYK